MTKDEALKMAIEALENNQTYDCEGNPMYAVEKENEKAINACKEALEQPLTRDWKETIDERIARDIEFKEALEQSEEKEFFERGKQIARWADKQALEQPAQEPVAWMYQREDGAGVLNFERNFALMDKGYKEIPLYTHPHQCQALRSKNG